MLIDTNDTIAIAIAIMPATINILSHLKAIANPLAIRGPANEAANKNVHITLEWYLFKFSDTIFIIGPRNIERPIPIKTKQATCIHANLTIGNRVSTEPVIVNPTDIIYLGFTVSPTIPLKSCPNAYTKKYTDDKTPINSAVYSPVFNIFGVATLKRFLE